MNPESQSSTSDNFHVLLNGDLKLSTPSASRAHDRRAKLLREPCATVTVTRSGSTISARALAELAEAEE